MMKHAYIDRLRAEGGWLPMPASSSIEDLDCDSEFFGKIQSSVSNPK
jgi:hypothetical protein